MAKSNTRHAAATTAARGSQVRAGVERRADRRSCKRPRATPASGSQPSGAASSAIRPSTQRSVSGLILFSITYDVLLFESLSSPGQQGADRSGVKIERSGQFGIRQPFTAKEEHGGLDRLN